MLRFRRTYKLFSNQLSIAEFQRHVAAFIVSLSEEFDADVCMEDISLDLYHSVLVYEKVIIEGNTHE